jgi:hypothetical protein
MDAGAGVLAQNTIFGCHSRVSGNPLRLAPWIPAYAGMTQSKAL